MLFWRLTYLWGRHHCRLCGGVFCTSCSATRLRAGFVVDSGSQGFLRFARDR
jgi:hypothetical protein